MLQALTLFLAVTAGLAGAADARMHAPYKAHRIVPAATAPLDGFTQPAGAYSFRKLRTAYAGSAVRLRRASDNLEADIGFVGTDFNTAAATAHCAATTCAIKTVYDQSGNARHVTDPDAIDQPAYTADCGDGQPCLQGTGTKFLLFGSVTPATGLMSFSAVARASEPMGCVLVKAGVQYLGTNAGGNPWGLWNGSAALNAVAPNGVWHVGNGVIAGAASVLRIDGAETAGTLAQVATAGASYIAHPNGTTGTCSFREGMWWDNYALTADERLALANNQKNYWMPLPLDSFATPAAAYSMRKLKSGYTGPAIRIRRASDNAELDINFLGFVPGLGAPLDIVAANTHCAATTCSVVTWYDQSGTAYHLTQATPANQPVLVFNCQGTLPCMQMTVSTQLLTNAANVTPVGSVSISVVANRTVGTAAACAWFRQNANNRLTTHAVANTWFIHNGAALVQNTANDNVWHAATGVLAGAGTYLNIDGVNVTGSLAPSVVVAASNIQGGAAVTCNLGEVAVWNNYALTAPEATALQANQRSFWGF